MYGFKTPLRSDVKSRKIIFDVGHHVYYVKQFEMAWYFTSITKGWKEGYVERKIVQSKERGK